MASRLVLRCCVGVFAALAIVGVASAQSSPWDEITKLLMWEVEVNQTMPGGVAAVGDANGWLYVQPFGNYTFAEVDPISNSTLPPMTTDTKFDMASCTKVLATTSAVMLLYQQGLLGLDTLIADPSLLGPEYAANGKGSIKVLNLLLHNAGYPPDPNPGYDYPQFGCPNPWSGNFECQEKIFNSLLNQTLQYPTGSMYVYSDLSMITMMYVIGQVVRANKLVPTSSLRPECIAPNGTTSMGATQCWYEAFVNLHVFGPTKMTSSGFNPTLNTWDVCAPTLLTPTAQPPSHIWRQGQVMDPNALAMGGIAGHAGLFATVGDIGNILRMLLWAPESGPWVNITTRTLFTKMYNVTQSSRALGWDTNSYVANTYRGCGNFSDLTYTHLGYTGTQVCSDPTRGVFTILLTARCFPDDTPISKCKVHYARQNYNNAVVKLLDTYGHVKQPVQGVPLPASPHSGPYPPPPPSPYCPIGSQKDV